MVRVIRAGIKAHNAHIDGSLVIRFWMYRIRNIKLRLDRRIPPVRLSAYRQIFGLPFNEAATAILHPADSRQIKLLARFINFEALRISEAVLVTELLVPFRKLAAAFEKVFERAHQILHALLQYLTMAV